MTIVRKALVDGVRHVTLVRHHLRQGEAIARLVTKSESLCDGRGDRVVEGARLEIVCAGNGTAGSNPAPSASEVILRTEIFSDVALPTLA